MYDAYRIIYLYYVLIPYDIIMGLCGHAWGLRNLTLRTWSVYHLLGRTHMALSDCSSRYTLSHHLFNQPIEASTKMAESTMNLSAKNTRMLATGHLRCRFDASRGSKGVQSTDVLGLCGLQALCQIDCPERFGGSSFAWVPTVPWRASRLSAGRSSIAIRRLG